MKLFAPFDLNAGFPLSMNLLGAPVSRRPVGSRKPELAGETPALPDIALRFMGRGTCLFILTGMLFGSANFSFAADTNSLAPVTARDFYNAGTKLLDAGKFPEAEQMFQSALAAQDERVQPPALYNLGHARFDDGAALLKKGPDAQKAAAQGNAALAAGSQALRQAESSLAEKNLDKMIAAYIEGRGARHELRDAEKAVQAAMETYGKTLLAWQRAADDFKSAAELNPADTNATRNAQLVERAIAKLVDSARQMQAMMGAMGKQRQDLGQTLSKLKGQIPASAAPPGAAGDDDDNDQGVQPDMLAGQKEGASHQGDQLQVPLSPDQAGQLLDGLSLDGSRRLPMSDKQGAPPNDKKGRDW
jgi:tetratricopeptide (TPR) repeat protein